MLALSKFAALALWALSVLTVVAAFSPSRFSRAETNAKRLSRGLPPARPRRLYSPSKTNAPRAAPSGASGNTASGYLALYSSGTTNVVGYVDSTGISSTQSVSFTFAIPDSSDDLIDFTSAYGTLGGFSTLSTVTLSASTRTVVSILTDNAGATPAHAAEGTYTTDSSGGQGFAQNTIWSMDLDTGLVTPHWVSPDGSVSTQSFVALGSQLYITANPSGARLTLGGGVLVDMAYVPA